MKKKHGLLLFAAGLLLLVIQFLMLAFQYINGDANNTEVVFSVAEEINFKNFISQFWSGLAGCILLVVLFVRRVTKSPDAMLTLVGVLLWVIQILSRFESQQILDFVLAYLIGIIGVISVGIAALCDAYEMKSKNPDDSGFNK